MQALALMLHSIRRSFLCQVCNKPRRRIFSHCVYMQILPYNDYYHKTLVRNGFNPRIEIYTHPSKLISEVIEHLNNKWNPSKIEGQAYSLELILSGNKKFNLSDSVNVGSISSSMRLYYAWEQIQQ